MKNIRRLSLVALASALLLSACGGGGDDPAAPTASPPVPTSYWDMDAYRYVNGFNSVTTSNIVGDIPDYTVAAISSVTTTPTSSSNLGAYTDSALAFQLIGSAPGTYTVAPADQLKQKTRSNNYIAVQSDIGIGVTTGSTRYVATSGTVTVTKDSHGIMHFTSATPLTMVKTLDILGGVAGAPNTMTLNIVDAY